MLSRAGRPHPQPTSQDRVRRHRLESLESRLAPGGMLGAMAALSLGAIESSAEAADRQVVEPRARSTALGTEHRIQAVPSSLGPDAVATTGNAPAQGSATRGAQIRSVGVASQSSLTSTGRTPAQLLEGGRFETLDDLLADSSDASISAAPRRAPLGLAEGGPSLAGPRFSGEAWHAATATVFSGTPWASPALTAAPAASASSAAEIPGFAGITSPAANADPAVAPAGSDETEVVESRVPRGLPYANQADRVQSLEPYALTYDASPLREPPTGSVSSPTEYDPMRGVLFSYASFSSIVTDMVKELTEDPAQDDIAYVVVSSAGQQTSATNSFTSAGADLSKVQFFIQPTDSVWIRDYGPHFTEVDNSLAIVDSHYYPNRSQDNFIPTLLGDNNFKLPTYDMGLYYSGGNFQPGPNRSGFVTSLVTYHNTVADGFNEDYISELYHDFQGIDTLHILPQLPFSVDATGHIDMWFYLVDEDTVVISEFAPGSNATATQIANNAVGYMENLGFEVFRTPAWNAGSTHYTYANAFRVNDRLFVPVYGTAIKPGGNAAYNDEDAAAMAVWQAAAGPGVEIIPIQCNGIISSAGAIHCIVKQVPRYTGSAPAASLISPAGGEILTVQSPYKIEWSAIDTNNVDPASIELSVSYNGGAYQPITTTTDTGSYLWTPSQRASYATIKLVARASDNDLVEIVSERFSISPGAVIKYDFSSGAGVDKFAYGSQTNSWNAINGNSAPVGSVLSASAYAAMATSNASGGDADGNRYIAPVPSPLANESTHVFSFEIAEPIGSIAEIDALWEGYADYCSQVELYVWDRVAQNWGNAAGLTGNNRYLDSWAGNADGQLTGSIRSDFSRYVDPSGVIRFLVYTDRTGTNPDTQHNAGQGIETFHDYMSVSVKQEERWTPTVDRPDLS